MRASVLGAGARRVVAREREEHHEAEQDREPGGEHAEYAGRAVAVVEVAAVGRTTAHEQHQGDSRGRTDDDDEDREQEAHRTKKPACSTRTSSATATANTSQPTTSTPAGSDASHVTDRTVRRDHRSRRSRGRLSVHPFRVSLVQFAVDATFRWFDHWRSVLPRHAFPSGVGHGHVSTMTCYGFTEHFADHDGRGAVPAAVRGRRGRRSSAAISCGARESLRDGGSGVPSALRGVGGVRAEPRDVVHGSVPVVARRLADGRDGEAER